MTLSESSIFDSHFVSISEFTLEDLRTISFQIENNSDVELNKFLSSKIMCDCNALDKFNLLLTARYKFINENITLNNGESNINLNLNLFKNNLLKNIINIESVVNIDNFYLTLNYPDNIFHENREMLEIDCIKHITYKGKEVNFKKLKIVEKLELYEKLPINIIREVKKFIDNNYCHVILMESKFNLPEISINLFDNSAFYFLKTLYNYYNYEDIVETLFMLSKRIPDIQYLNSRNPRDLDILIRLYNDDVDNSDQPVKLHI